MFARSHTLISSQCEMCFFGIHGDSETHNQTVYSGFCSFFVFCCCFFVFVFLLLFFFLLCPNNSVNTKECTVDSRYLDFSNNRLSRSENLVPVLTWKSNNR